MWAKVTVWKTRSASGASSSARSTSASGNASRHGCACACITRSASPSAVPYQSSTRARWLPSRNGWVTQPSRPVEDPQLAPVVGDVAGVQVAVGERVRQPARPELAQQCLGRARWRVGSSCRSASVSRAISGLLARTSCHASSVASRPRSGQPAAAQLVEPVECRDLRLPPQRRRCVDRTRGPVAVRGAAKRLHEHPAGPVVRPGQHGHQVSDPVGEATHDGRLGDEVVAARLEPQRAAVGRDLEHGRDAPDPVRAEGAGPPTTGRGQLVVHPRLDAVVPAGTEPVGPSGRGLAVVLLERRADRRPHGSARSSTRRQSAPTGAPSRSARTCNRSGRRSGTSCGSTTTGATCTPWPASVEAYAVGSGASSSSRSCTKLGSDPSAATRTVSPRTSATWCVR